MRSCSAPEPCWKVAGKPLRSRPPSPSASATRAGAGCGGGDVGAAAGAGAAAAAALRLLGVCLAGVPRRGALRAPLRGVVGCGELAADWRRACRAGVLRSTRDGGVVSSPGGSRARLLTGDFGAGGGGGGESGAPSCAASSTAAVGESGAAGGGTSGERASAERLTLRSDFGGDGSSGAGLEEGRWPLARRTDLGGASACTGERLGERAPSESSDSEPRLCRASRASLRTDLGGETKDGVRIDACERLLRAVCAEAGGESSMAAEVSGRGSLPGGVACGEPALSPVGARSRSSGAGSASSAGKAIARRVGGAGMRDGAAAAGFLALVTPLAFTPTAATFWIHTATSAYSGRERSSGVACRA